MFFVVLGPPVPEPFGVQLVAVSAAKPDQRLTVISLANSGHFCGVDNFNGNNIAIKYRHHCRYVCFFAQV